MNFTIYPKKGEPFSLELDEFKVEQDRITIKPKNSRHSGFLTLNDIAAIIPEHQPTPFQHDKNLLSIAVYLKGRVQSPITVLTHAYKHEKDLAEIEFYWTNVNPSQPGSIKNDYIYLVASEVLALVPMAADK